MSEQKRAVILVSGGLDSTTVLAMAQSQGYACYTLSFDYGQRHRAELYAADRVSRALGDVEHKLVKLNLDSIGGSALTDMSIAVPEEGNGRYTYHLCASAQYGISVDSTRLGGGAGCARYLYWRECGGLFRLSGLSSRIHCSV